MKKRALALVALMGLAPMGAEAIPYLRPEQQHIVDLAVSTVETPGVGSCTERYNHYWSAVVQLSPLTNEYIDLAGRNFGGDRTVTFDTARYLSDQLEALAFKAGDNLLSESCPAEALSVFRRIFDDTHQVTVQNKAMERMQEARDALAKKP